MGLALIALLKASGVGRVEVCDVSPDALLRASAFGADATHLPEDPPQPCAFVFETAGSQGALTWCGELTARLGTLTIVGYHPMKREIDMGVWAGKALTVINAFEYDRSIQLQNMRHALELTGRGELPLKRLFTHSFPLHQVDRAFQTHLNRPEGFIKGYIRMDAREDAQ
jgi:threonine dehydrogenase-like Zn-dependent dehydrogenase